MSIDASRLPNLIVVGVQKCGTTALHHYLRRHPAVAMSRPKELDFFIEERNWARGLEWYAAHFDPSAPVRGESSPNYTAVRRFPGVVPRMQRVVPAARIVFMVRDPVDRLISHWVHRFTYGRERRALEQVVQDDTYLERSQYATQLRPYLEVFPRDRILILEMTELRQRRRETLRRVFEFAGVDTEFWSPLFHREPHRSSAKRQKTRLGRRLAASRIGAWADHLTEPWRAPVLRLMYLPFSRPLVRPVLGDAARAALTERLRGDAEEFRALTGRPFENWSI